MSEETASITRRLDRLALRPRTDELLDLVSGVAGMERGIAYPVGIITGGHIIRGAITADERFAALADAANAEVLDNYFPAADRQDEDIWQQFLQMFSDAVRRAREQTAEDRSVFEKYSMDASLDDFNDEDVIPILRANAQVGYLTIADAVIQIGEARVAVGAVRVAVASIAAWWPLAAEEGVNITFNITRPPSSPPQP